MRKPAVHDLPPHVALHPVVGERWSPRAFDPTPLPAEVMRSLLEAARWAPSAMNAQPWRFVVGGRDTDGTPDAAFTALREALFPNNRGWAQHAAALILVTTRVREDDGRPRAVGPYELGLAVGAMTAQAGALGLHIHQMGGYDHDVARAALGVPEEHADFAVLAVGAYGDLAALPEALAEREKAPRSRLPLDQIAWGATWGEPWTSTPPANTSTGEQPAA